MRLSEKHNLLREFRAMAQAMKVEQATVTVREHYNANPGKKFGKIIDQTGNQFMAEPAVLAQLTRGQTVVIEFGTQRWGDKPVQVINRILDAAPRTTGTQAPEPVDSLDVSARMFAYNFMAAVYQGTGTHPGAEILQKQLYQTRCAYHTAFGRPVQIIRSSDPPAVPVPTPERPASKVQMGSHYQDGPPPQQEDWEAPYPP